MAFVLSVATIMGVGVLDASQAHADSYTWSGWKKCWYMTDDNSTVGYIWVRYNVQWNRDYSARRLYAVGYDAGSGSAYHVDHVWAREANASGTKGSGQAFNYVPAKTGRWYPGALTAGQAPWIDKNTGLRVYFTIHRNSGTGQAEWAYGNWGI
jgi:hypothetical protein